MKNEDAMKMKMKMKMKMGDGKVELKSSELERFKDRPCICKSGGETVRSRYHDIMISRYHVASVTSELLSSKG
jgi:hypothetical protein